MDGRGGMMGMAMGGGTMPGLLAGAMALPPQQAAGFGVAGVQALGRGRGRGSLAAPAGQQLRPHVAFQGRGSRLGGV